MQSTSIVVADSMQETAAVRRYQSPKRWLRLGKYLLPGQPLPAGWRRTSRPKEQVSITQLAADYPDYVSLRTLGSAEVLPEYEYEHYDAGERQHHTLASEFTAPSFIAEVRNGVSFGRHCCAIGPNSKAIRETGFNLDGGATEGGVPLGRFQFRSWRKRLEGDVTARPWLPPKQHVTGCVAILNTRYSHNFYHWLCDILPRLVPLRASRTKPDYYLVESLSSFQQEVLMSLGIEPRQLIQPHCRLLLEADCLLVPSLPTPSCLRAFREFLLDRLGVERKSKQHRRIYITRRKSGKRGIADEHLLDRVLHDYGFETHAMEEYPLQRQAQLIHDATTVVAVHGAGLANLTFARPGTNVIEIVPRDRTNAYLYPDKSRTFGLRHLQIAGKIVGRKQQLEISLDDVAAALSSSMSVSRRALAA